MSAAKKTTGSVLSDAEKAAMKATVAERRAAAKGAKAEDDVKAVLDAIAKMSDHDRALCTRLHEIITTAAPELAPRTWYGMPAYAKDGKVLLAVKNSGKFGQRYTSLEFQDVAQLDSGSMWPVSWAVTTLTKTGEKDVAALVRKAVG
ncbi:DUF1801 domain-containing protein [Phycicoccus sonneratiae]|uniref:DUF1801 domain-containing protein n=1 Tax=Phycicoccus sonneratiae TaxID=2807628 RepID=A0ABS2CI83_9MICO|nr:DUF1801 domain-containing protein [Phycicoccus sonneraticus]MBM6399563.1 DUF1801 domain-containing protein [Phycicoccus sonneraticus]